MDELDQWKHLLTQLAYGLETKEQLAVQAKTTVDRFRQHANAADQVALKTWLRHEIGSISIQVVPASGMENRNRRAHVLQAALDAFER